MGWLKRLFGAGGEAPRVITEKTATPPAFTCTTCGRTDLPEAGGWDPPVCQECDAAINKDAVYEADAFDDP